MIVIPHLTPVVDSGVTESFVFLGGAKGGGRPSSVEGGQDDGIAMIYCAQSKVKWGGGGGNGVNGGGMAPHSYATGCRTVAELRHISWIAPRIIGVKRTLYLLLPRDPRLNSRF